MRDYHSEPNVGREVIDSVIKAKIMGLSTPGTVNLMAKYHIGVSS